MVKVYAAEGIGTRLTGTWLAREITPAGEIGPVIQTQRSRAKPVGGGPSFPRSALYTRQIGTKGAYGPLRPYGMGIAAPSVPQPLPDVQDPVRRIENKVFDIIPNRRVAVTAACTASWAVPGLSRSRHWISYAFPVGGAALGALWGMRRDEDKGQIVLKVVIGYLLGSTLPCVALNVGTPENF